MKCDFAQAQHTHTLHFEYFYHVDSRRTLKMANNTIFKSDQIFVGEIWWISNSNFQWNQFYALFISIAYFYIGIRESQVISIEIPRNFVNFVKKNDQKLWTPYKIGLLSATKYNFEWSTWSDFSNKFQHHSSTSCYIECI